MDRMTDEQRRYVFEKKLGLLHAEYFKDDLYHCGIEAKKGTLVGKTDDKFKMCIFKKIPTLNRKTLHACNENRKCALKECYWMCGPTLGNEYMCDKCILGSKCKKLYYDCL